MTNKRSLVIEDWIGQFVKDNNLYVLRERRSGRALNVSYSEDGLRWTVNKLGRSLYYRDAIMRLNSKTKFPELVTKRKTLEKNRDVFVEKFIPKNHWKPNGKLNIANQVAELLWIDKALRLCYYVEPKEEENPLVYSTADAK